MKAVANVSMLFKESGPIVNRFKAAADAGFRFVESDFPTGVSPSVLSGKLEENGLSQVLINCFHGDAGESGFAATPGKEDQFRAAVLKTLDYLRAANCKRTHLLSGPCLGEQQRPAQLQTLESNLRWASVELAKDGVVGLIEPINPHSKPGYFLNSYDTAISILDKVDSPNIKLQLDLFHMQLITGDITNNIKKLLPYTGHIQIAQSPYRNEPSYPGELNFKYVFQQLELAGYDGFVGCEYSPSGLTADSLSWIKEYGLTF